MAAFWFDMSEVVAFLAIIGFFFGVGTVVVITGVVFHEAVRSGISSVKLRILNNQRLRHGQFRAHPQQHSVSRVFVR